MHTKFGNIFLTLILALIAANPLCAQLHSAPPAEENFADTIPIEVYNNLVILPVSIDGKGYRFILDTGCSVSMLRSDLLTEETTIIKRDTVSDANHNKNEVAFVELCKLSIGKLHFPCFQVIPLSFAGTPWECAQIDGCLGGDILQNLIVKIDVRRKRVILTDRKKWFRKEKGASGAMQIRNNCPYLTLRIGSVKVEDVMFDSGSTTFYSLCDGIFNQLKAFKPHWWMGEVIDTAKGATSFGFFGFAKEDSISLVKLPQWKLCGVPFKNVYTKTNQNTHCSLGARLLGYGQVVLDYPGKRFIFLPYDNARTISVQAERFINFGPVNGQILVTLIFEKSEYYRQGLRQGDRVIEINHREIKDDICILQEALSESIMQLKVVDEEGNEKEFHLPLDAI